MNCKKGQGTKEKGFADRCYWYYNGECIRSEKDKCYYNIGKKDKASEISMTLCIGSFRP